MRLLVAALALIAGCYGCAAMAPAPMVPDPAPKSIEDMRATTVGLVFPNKTGSFYIGCAGVWVGPSSILTAAHCTDDDGTSAFMTYAEVGAHGDAADRTPPFHYAHVVARDEVLDLALLSVLATMPAHHVAYVATSEVYAGQHVHLVGHGYGLPYTWAPGVVSSVRELAESLEFPVRGWFTLVIGESRGGNSGGGLWDDDGHLLGICSQSDRKGFSFYVARRTVADFLSKNL